MNMPNDDRVSEGYLLLADISGYTAFLTGTELEHAHAIIRELTKLIRSRLAPPMKFVKLEGDAVFCYAGANAFKDGERFVELIEVCYFDFANRLQDMTRATTCKCDACRASPSPTADPAPYPAFRATLTTLNTGPTHGHKESNRRDVRHKVRREGRGCVVFC